MFATLFKNPKAALAYVGITLGSVVLFVGTEDDPGSLQQTVDTLGGEESGADQAAERGFGASQRRDRIGGISDTQDSDEPVEFVPDEELIDDLSGFDPAPTDVIRGYNPDPNFQTLLSEQEKLKEQDDGGWGASPDD
ncbi:hypothetical protein [Erythrobacter sp. MTPC3]|uniref:hypothetical protein n=1 Tax=Erythrobacter sp. MTPC3 TaxID=3056564 RepID=UPI0036F20A01